MKRTFLLLFIGVSFGFQSTEFSFTDAYGNEFTIESTKQIPKVIDTEFLKTNLNGTHFPFTPNANQKLKIRYTITEFEKLKQMEYQIRLRTAPKSDKIEDILMYLGVRYYRMKLKKTKSGIELEAVEFMYSEI